MKIFEELIQKYEKILHDLETYGDNKDTIVLTRILHTEKILSDMKAVREKLREEIDKLIICNKERGMPETYLYREACNDILRLL
jgi:hypothetical protein